MAKKILNFVIIVFLASGVIAGGDDRDKGPVESLDSISPVIDKKVVGKHNAETLVLTDPAKQTIPDIIESAGRAVYETCEDTFASSDIWVKYTCVFALGLLAL